MTENKSRLQHIGGSGLLGRILLMAILALSIAGCGGGDSDNGEIIGTGVLLKGTASTTRTLAQADVLVKASSGETSTAPIAANGTFSNGDIAGDGPYLMRINLGNNDYLYSIGHADSNGSIRQNVHSYTDLVARNWFSRRGLDIDTAFSGNETLPPMPTPAETQAIQQRLQAMVALVLSVYDLGDINLASASFTANGSGIDHFLDRNPVWINNGQVTVIINHPSDNRQSIATTNLGLNTDLTTADNVPPDAPANIRALPASGTETVIVFDPASDNIGISGYQIYRDDELIATTPFPVYTDTGLSSDTAYDYEVVAIDASGNTSSRSVTASVTTSAEPDVTPPPTPVSLTLNATTSTVSASWHQSEIGDVTGFRVIRNQPGDTGQIVNTVTSTFYTDVHVNSGTEYCYQIAAVDASGNTSSPTPTSCVTTLGAFITTDDSNDSDDSGENNEDAVTGSPAQCSTPLEQTIIRTNTTLSLPCYLVTENLRVEEPANLTIAAGVTLRFASGTQLTVEDGASLSAQGTAQKPIWLTGDDHTVGYWNGVTFLYSNSSRNVLEHVVIQYAGGQQGNGANLLIQATTVSPSRVKISNLTSRHSAGQGFIFHDGSLIDQFDNNTITMNQMTGSVSPNLAGALTDSSSYTGNTEDLVEIRSGKITTATNLYNINVPWIADQILVEDSLSIDAGNEIRFQSEGSIRVDESGSLSVNGTSLDPVLLTATDPTPGYWDGVRFSYSNSSANSLEHVIVEYAGTATNGSANVFMQSTTISPSRLSVDHLISRYSLGAGFHFHQGSVLDKFDNVTSTGNQSSGIAGLSSVSSIGTGIAFQGNQNNYIEVISGRLDGTQTWSTIDVPYFITDLKISGTLNLVAGTTILADSSAEIRVEQDSRLLAHGTAAAPVVFTGKEAIAGYWAGIRLIFSGSVPSVLDHVVIEYAGGNGDSNYNGNIEMICNSLSPSVLQLSNTRVENSGGWGLFLSDEGCDLTLGSNVSFAGNAAGDINLQ